MALSRTFIRDILTGNFQCGIPHRNKMGLKVYCQLVRWTASSRKDLQSRFSITRIFQELMIRENPFARTLNFANATINSGEDLLIYYFKMIL